MNDRRHSALAAFRGPEGTYTSEQTLGNAASAHNLRYVKLSLRHASYRGDTLPSEQDSPHEPRESHGDRRGELETGGDE